jgi:polyferredoxin
MVPKTERQVRWLKYAIWSVTIFGGISILSVPAFFGGYVPFWVPILTLTIGAVTYFLCLKQVHRQA